MTTTTAAPTTASAAPAAGVRPADLPQMLARARGAAEGGDVGGALTILHDLLQRAPDHAPLMLRVAGSLRDDGAVDAATFADLVSTPGAISRLHVPAGCGDAAGGGVGSMGSLGVAIALRRARRLGEAAADPRDVVGPLLAVFLATPPARLPSVAPRVVIQAALLLDEAGLVEAAWEIASFATARWPRSMALRTVTARLAVETRHWDDLARLLGPVFAATKTPRLARGYEALHALALGRLAHAASHFDAYGIPHDAAFLAELAILLAPHDDRFGSRTDNLPTTIDLPADKDAMRALGRAEGFLFADRIEEGLAALEVPARTTTSKLPTPAQALWLRLRGFALFKLRRFDEAALAFAAAAAADPHDAWYVSGAGQAFLFRGDAASAVACFRQVQPAGPDDFAALFHLGLAYARLGRLADARRALRRAFREFFVDTLEVSLQPMLRAILGPAAEAAHAETMRV